MRGRACYEMWRGAVVSAGFRLCGARYLPRVTHPCCVIEASPLWCMSPLSGPVRACLGLGTLELLEGPVLQASEDTVMAGAVLVWLVVSGVGENPRAGSRHRINLRPGGGYTSELRFRRSGGWVEGLRMCWGCVGGDGVQLRWWWGCWLGGKDVGKGRTARGNRNSYWFGYACSVFAMLVDNR